MKKVRVLTILLFFLIVGGISIASLLTKDREFSPNENRYLSMKPKFSVAGFMDGSWQEDLESYLNDQIAGRDAWITAKTALQSACGDTDIGGAYLGKNGYDFEKITEDDVNRKLFERNADTVQAYFDSCSEVIDPSRLSFLLIPTSALIMKEHLPANAPMFDQEAYINTVAEHMTDYNFIDVRPVLAEHSGEGVYYRTDHHWTSKGAYYGYLEWCRATGHTLYGEDEYTVTTVSEDFRGSLYSKILNFNSAYDKIDNYKRTASTAQFQVVKDGEAADGFYETEKLSEKDQYAYFFGGNYAEMVITRTAPVSPEGEERVLLVVKDSFANTFLPFLAEEYDRIYVVDLRYYTGKMGLSYIEENRITDVLLLYNISNFISDKNIYRLTNG